MPFQIIRDDITRVACDAIVNATDKQISGSGGVDQKIRRGAGIGLAFEKKKIKSCEEGKAVLTGGHNLPCRYIIHTVGPHWKGGENGEQDTLRSCYRESLTLAKQQKCETVAFPLIASGTFGYPKELALQIAIEEIGRFLLQHDMLIYLVVFDKESFSVSKKLISEIEEHIDERYIEEQELTCSSAILEDADDASATIRCKAQAPRPSACWYIPTKSEDWRDVLGEVDESFSQMLLRKIDEKGIKDSDCYKRANVDRKLFSKIRKDIYYKPRKHTVLAFAIALELSLPETKELLMKAGYALTHSSLSDLVVEYFITHENYNIFEINEALFALDQSLLGI